VPTTKQSIPPSRAESWFRSVAVAAATGLVAVSVAYGAMKAVVDDLGRRVDRVGVKVDTLVKDIQSNDRNYIQLRGHVEGNQRELAAELRQIVAGQEHLRSELSSLKRGRRR